MNKKNWIIAIAIMLAVIGTANAQKYEPEGNFKVETNGMNSSWIETYKGKNKNVNIPPIIKKMHINSISSGAFSGKKLTSVIIPVSITSIDDNAFSNNQLTSITIGSNVRIRDNNAFDNGFVQAYEQYGKKAGTYTLNNGKWVNEEIDKALSARITDPLTEENFKFEQNKQGGITITGYINEKQMGIRDLVIPSQIYGINVTEIGQGAFAKGSYASGDILMEFRAKGSGEVFESVTIPPTVTSIGAVAFVGRGIKTLNLPESVRTIGIGAFAENQLSSVILPAGLRSIGGGAFAKNRLSSVTLPEGIQGISVLSFARNQLTSIVIPSSVTVIGMGAFGGNQLTEVTIPENVTIIYSEAFAANKISKITFSDSGKLRTIQSAAFAGNQLKSVVLPEGLTEIAQAEFGQHSERGAYFGVSEDGGIFGGNPLVYIKIPSTLTKAEVNASHVPFIRGVVPAIEWSNPSIIKYRGDGAITIGKADALKIGANIDTSNMGFDQSFINFYSSQGNKAGIYMRRGPLWVTATQEEFDAFIAEKTK